MSCEPCMGWGCCIRVVHGGAAARRARGCVAAQPLAASLLPAALLHARLAVWGTAVWGCSIPSRAGPPRCWGPPCCPSCPWPFPHQCSKSGAPWPAPAPSPWPCPGKSALFPLLDATAATKRKRRRKVFLLRPGARARTPASPSSPRRGVDGAGYPHSLRSCGSCPGASLLSGVEGLQLFLTTSL